MTMRQAGQARWAVATAVAAALALAGVVQGAADDRRGAVIVVPRRPTLVQMAFDMQRLRPAVIVCVENVRALAEPALHVWDTADQTWKRMSVGHFESGRFIAFTPRHVLLIGEDADFPASIGACQAWGSETVRLSNLAFADLINDLDRTFAFSSREWTWLADRYQLQLKDTNYIRRRYGKYGPPGGAKAAPPVKIEDQRGLPEPEPAPAGVEIIAPEPVEPAAAPGSASMLDAPAPAPNPADK